MELLGPVGYAFKFGKLELSHTHCFEIVKLKCTAIEICSTTAAVKQEKQLLLGLLRTMGIQRCAHLCI